MLSRCPLLRELRLIRLQGNPTGNLNSLRVRKNTLEEVFINSCCSIQGNFMELADFPCLKDLSLFTPFLQEIIQEDDFSAAEGVILRDTVIGGFGYSFSAFLMYRASCMQFIPS